MWHFSIISGDGCGHPAMRQLIASGSCWLCWAIWCCGALSVLLSSGFITWNLAEERSWPQDSCAGQRAGLSNTAVVGSTPLGRLRREEGWLWPGRSKSCWTQIVLLCCARLGDQRKVEKRCFELHNSSFFIFLLQVAIPGFWLWLLIPLFIDNTVKTEVFLLSDLWSCGQRNKYQ